MHRIRIRSLGVSLLAAALLFSTACSHNETKGCGDVRYLASRTDPPLRVPDQLTVPDEADALRVPGAAAEEPPAAEQPCLQTPPQFFDNGNNGNNGNDGNDGDSGDDNG